MGSHGRWAGTAVHRLLGGPTRTSLPVYASNIGYQADTYWAGGVTEMLKIGSMCSLFDAPLIPHGLSVLANVQLIASQPTGLYPPDRPRIDVDLDESKMSKRIPLTWD